MPFKLSPSDFAYLYEECKLCYWLKVREGISQPSKPMPGVFSAINTRLQGMLVGKELKELSEVLPGGIVESQEGFVESIVYPNTNVYIKGKYDLLIKQPDGTYLIVDFKISQPSEEKIPKYQTQLYSYKFAIENPKFGQPKKITKMGLIVMYPDQTEFKNGKAYLDFPPKWLEVKEDPTSFSKFMLEVSSLLDGPMPQAGENCAWCKYFEKLENRGQTVKEPKEQAQQLPF